MKNLLILFAFLSFGLQAQHLEGIIAAGTQPKIRVAPNPTSTVTIVDDSLARQGNGDNQMNFVGVWDVKGAEHPGSYGQTISYSTTADAYVTVSCANCTKIEYYAEQWEFPGHGFTALSVDGGSETMVNQYIVDSLRGTQRMLYSTGTLTLGAHTIKARVTHTKDALSNDYYSTIDYFKIYSPYVAPPPPIDPGDPIPDVGSLYVAQNVVGASNSNPCTSLLAPCLTIDGAAQKAISGDVIIVKAGTYRETISPINSGNTIAKITFKAAAGETVLVTGLNQVLGAWTNHSGSIYKVTQTLPIATYGGQTTSNTALLANQVFKDGAMQFEASSRALSTMADLFDITKWKAQTSGFGATSLTDAALNGFGLAGGKIVCLGWFWSRSATITSQSGNTINWSPSFGTDVRFNKYYFVIGKLSLLDQAKEWFYDGAGTLYFQQTGGGSPTGVEYKARNWGFDLRGKSYIDIIGVTFKGCEPVMGNSFTNYVTLDNIRASYTNHSITHETQVWQGYGNAQQTGLGLRGVGNTLKNSELIYGGSTGVWIGASGLVHNNKIQYYGYDGMWGPGVGFWGNDDISNITVSNNTFDHLGRGAIDNGYQSGQSRAAPPRTRNNRITMNDISYWGMLNQDVGAFYSWGWQDLSGGRIDHNWWHDAGIVPYPVPDVNGAYTDGISGAIYFDMGSGADPGQPAIIIDHNVMWNNSANSTLGGSEVTDFYTLPAFEYSQIATQPAKYQKQPAKIYNNTFYGQHKSYTTYQTAVTDIFRNNIFHKEINVNWPAQPYVGGNNTNYILYNVDPLLTGGSLSTPGTYFTLQSGSPAKDTGVAIAGITTDAVGTPDKGAYERGATVWIPGYVQVSSPTGGTAGTGDITALNDPADIVVPYQTAFGTNGATVGLPSAINCTLTGGVAGTVPMTWAVGSYVPYQAASISGGNFYTDATYAIVGTPVTGSGITNTTSITVSVNVTVQDPFTPLTSGVAGLWYYGGLVNNTTNTFGTVASGAITLVKSLLPGPLSRDLVANGTAPTLSGGKAVLTAAHSFQTGNKTDFKFMSYNATANLNKWTYVSIMNLTDNGANNYVLGDNGFNAANDGMVIIMNTTGALTTASMITTGTGGIVNGADFTSSFTTGVDKIYAWQMDYSLGTAGRSVMRQGATKYTTTSSGTAAFRNNTSDDEMNFGAGGQGSGNATGTRTLDLVLTGTESDAVMDKLLSDISVSTCGCL